mgnify:CR=1 FL=1
MSTASIASGLGKFLSLLSGSPGLPQNALAAANSLSTAGAAAFNLRHPQGIPSTSCGEGAYNVNGVAYFSWSGASNYTNLLDVLDPAMSITGLAFAGAMAVMVPSRSAPMRMRWMVAGRWVVLLMMSGR